MLSAFFLFSGYLKQKTMFSLYNNMSNREFYHGILNLNLYAWVYKKKLFKEVPHEFEYIQRN